MCQVACCQGAVFSAPPFEVIFNLKVVGFRVSGHLMSTAEVEAALAQHPAVSEAAVVSRPHKVKGECLHCFVTLKDTKEFNQKLVEELKKQGEALLKKNFSNVNVNL